MLDLLTKQCELSPAGVGGVYELEGREWGAVKGLERRVEARIARPYRFFAPNRLGHSALKFVTPKCVARRLMPTL